MVEATDLLHTNYMYVSGLQAPSKIPDGGCNTIYTRVAGHTSSKQSGTAGMVSPYVTVRFSSLASGTALISVSKSSSPRSPPHPFF
jgi:hypothetical protein